MATKTSILIFYLRLFKNTWRSLWIASWVVLGIVNITGTILTFMNIFQCQPTHAAWDITTRPTRCLPLLTEFICSAPVNVTTDLAILVLPIPMLTSIQLPRRQKIILILTFALGTFVTVVDVIRIYYLQLAIDQTTTSASADMPAKFGQIPDFSWNAALTLMWSAVEVNVGIICACIPTLKPLIIRILPAMVLGPDKTVTDITRRSSTWSSGPFASGGAMPPSSQPPTTSTTPLSPIHSRPSFADISPYSPTDSRPSLSSTDISISDFLSANTNQRARTFPLEPPPHPRSRRPTSTSTIHPPTKFRTLPPPTKPILPLPPSQSRRACCLVTVLFFLWGFSYGLLNTLNSQAADVAGLGTRARTLGLTSVYFGGGYLWGPALLGGWLLTRGGEERWGWSCLRGRRFRRKRRGGKEVVGDGVEVEVRGRVVGGFKATFVAGLLIYGVGTITFWPGASLAAYGGFVVSNFVVGFGLAVLETAANPFLVLCGPPGGYADARLLLAQGVQAVGSVLSGVLANRVFFAGAPVTTVASLMVDVQWTYLAVTLLSVMLALVFYYVPLPEVEDGELADMASRLTVDPKRRWVGGMSLRAWAVVLAVLAQWCYVSAQENMSLFFKQLTTAFVPAPPGPLRPINPDLLKGLVLSLPNYLLVARSAFAFSRFLASGLCYLSARFPSSPFFPTPRTLLSTVVFSSAVCILTAVVLPITTNPNRAIIPVILFFFFEGPIWPLVFSLGLRGQGDRTKRASVWITMGGSGPAVWPFVSYGILRAGGNVQVAMVVVVVLMAVVGVYPLFLTVVKGAREMVDKPPGEAVVDQRKRSEGSESSERSQRVEEMEEAEEIQRGITM